MSKNEQIMRLLMRGWKGRCRMEAGRELDAMVAEKVFGYKRYTVPPDYDGKNSSEILVPPDFNEKRYSFPPKGRIAFTFFVKDYSTTYEGMGLVLEKMRMIWSDVSVWTSGSRWSCGWSDGYELVYVTADTAPEAICRAALKAKEGKNEQD